jgi:hypothetical protein
MRKITIQTLLLVGACWTAAIVINLRFHPTDVPYGLLNMVLLVLTAGVHRSINKTHADRVHKWFSAATSCVLILSALEYSLFQIQRPYSIIVWMIAWEVAEVIMVFRAERHKQRLSALAPITPSGRLRKRGYASQRTTQERRPEVKLMSLAGGQKGMFGGGHWRRIRQACYGHALTSAVLCRNGLDMPPLQPAP